MNEEQKMRNITGKSKEDRCYTNKYQISKNCIKRLGKKRTFYIVILTMPLLVLFGGCSTETSKGANTNSNQVENVINAQIQQSNDSTDVIEDEDADVDGISSERDTAEESLEEDTSTQDDPIQDEDIVSEDSGNNQVDIDLTTMGSDMVYATVYEMMVDPDSYVGKTIKTDGYYSAYWYDVTEQYYYYVVIQDAMACCAQGLEFIWDDGSHVYPDEYPEDGTEIEVTGVFTTYMEGDSMYCTLKDASMVVLN